MQKAASRKQIAALKYVIFSSKSLGNMTKRILAKLIDASKGFTRPVQIEVQRNTKGFNEKDVKGLYRDFSVATSTLGTIHLNELLQLGGCELRFTYSEDDLRCRCGLWPRKGNEKPKMLKVSWPILEEIDLSKPGLYPELEESQVHQKAS
jgi:hypothetical protein